MLYVPAECMRTASSLYEAFRFMGCDGEPALMASACIGRAALVNVPVSSTSRRLDARQCLLDETAEGWDVLLLDVEEISGNRGFVDAQVHARGKRWRTLPLEPTLPAAPSPPVPAQR